jgi:hypothetical protein
MKTDHLTPIEDFLANNTTTQGELNHNGVLAPKIKNKTVFSSHKKVKDVKLDDFKVLKVIGRGSF